MMDSKTCRFDGCGLMYKNLYELIHHIEEDHMPEIEKKKLQELEDLKQPKPLDQSSNGAEGNEGDSSASNTANQPQERITTISKGHKVFPISPKKVTMNFCQYRKRPSVNESLSNELTSPLHSQQIHANQLVSSSAHPFGSFQAPNAKRPARRISELGSDSGLQKDLKPSIPAGSIVPMEERRYRCDVEGCKKAYKNTQGLSSRFKKFWLSTFGGSSPRLSPSEEGILSRQLPSTNLVSPLTTGLSSQAQPVAVVESDGRADETGQEVVLDNAAYAANNMSNIQQRQIVQQTMSSSFATLGAQRIQQQQQQQQRSYTTSKYPCQHCPKTYKTIMNLNKHMQESHPKQVANTFPKQLLTSPSATSRTSSLVHPNGPSPTPMSPSAGQSQQQILVSSGGHPQSPAHGSNLIAGVVPASPQNMAHVQSSSYVHGAHQQQQQPNQQQQYYVTTNSGQVLHQQNHPSRGYSYQQEHQYTSSSNSSGQQQQVQPPPYSSTTSSPVQGTTIYVSQQQQQSPIHLQQYTVSGAPSQQQVYNSSSNQSTTMIDANRIIVGRAGAQPPSVFTQQSRAGQSGQPGVIHHRVHHSHPYTTTQPGGRQPQQQYQQRLLASSGTSQQQASSNATTIRVSSLNPYHHAQAGGPGQPQYVQVQQQSGNSSGIPVSQQQQIGSTVQAVAVSQPSYVSQQMASNHIPSSFVVRTSNHSYVKQSQQQPFASNNSNKPLKDITLLRLPQILNSKAN
uniref:C2H2-type domain-containing protein n=1 Tax=Ditylenchus dipsaci TaxID=166011 RepID=A0A915ECE3_9BILA